MKLAIKIWKLTFGALAKYPIILLPFIIVGLFDAFSLLLLYLAPQAPISFVFAPPIRAFWGERFLHYPLNFVLMPRLFGFAHIINTAIIGVLMTGLAIGMLSEAKGGNKPRALPNLILAFKKYFIIFAIWLLMYILATLVYKIPPLFLKFSSKAVFQIVFYLCFLIVVLIEVIFIYAIPATIIERRGLISAIKRGMLLSKSYFLTTIILVAIPSLLYIPIVFLKAKSVALMVRLFPEIVLIILGIGIVVTVLIDCIVTCSIATLFINQERK